MDIFTEERAIYVKKELPVNFVEFEDVVIISLAWFKRQIYGGAV